MITDEAEIEKLAFRSDLPRLGREGFHLFAQLDAGEQKSTAEEKVRLLATAYVALVARAERQAERPLPSLVPRAYQSRELPSGWTEIDLAFDLAEPFERRNRAGQVLAVTKYLKGRVRLFNGAFAYFAGDDLRPLETLDSTGFRPLLT